MKHPKSPRVPRDAAFNSLSKPRAMLDCVESKIVIPRFLNIFFPALYDQRQMFSALYDQIASTFNIEIGILISFEFCSCFAVDLIFTSSFFRVLLASLADLLPNC